MVDWLNTNDAAAQAIAAFISAAATLVLVAVTIVYARITRRISCATERQAEATSCAVKETAMQRLAQDEPILVLDVESQAKPRHLEWQPEEEVWRDTRSGKAVAPEDWPLPELRVRVVNVGRGPATSVEATYLREGAFYFADKKSLLLSGEKVTLDIGSAEVPLVEMAPWQRKFLEMKRSDLVPFFLVAVCDDIHGRSWVSFVGLDWHPADMPILVPLGQERVAVPERGHEKVVGLRAD